jgi:hypothetical protein
MYFPDIHGSNLNGRTFNLPHDLEGQWNILFVAFQMWHQEDVNTWLPLANELLRKYPTTHYYELPVVGLQSVASQTQINRGMRSGIRDWSTRAKTITLYVPREDFCDALDLPDDRRMYTLLVSRTGEVAWAAEGPLISANVAEDLEITLASLDVQPLYQIA